MRREERGGRREAGEKEGLGGGREKGRLNKVNFPLLTQGPEVQL